MCHNMGANVSVTCLNRAKPVMEALGAENVFALEAADVEKQLLKEERSAVILLFRYRENLIKKEYVF